MLNLQIVIAPNTVLEKVAEPVQKVHDKLRRTMHKMLDLMYEANGIGLAAPQVGISQRFFVMHVDDNEEPFFFINPVIIKKSSITASMEEGCLSFPGKNIPITRPQFITVQYTDLDEKLIVQDFEGLHAVCIQHEIDHLNGITIPDYLEHEEEKILVRSEMAKK